jgi:hypothetical protein
MPFPLAILMVMVIKTFFSAEIYIKQNRKLAVMMQAMDCS